ncbi:hypothetical protein [Prosthecomicrobium sp. N25]|uniref:hypothetical protein n=1 Tax=Prosthecomicrobium sp. N25 TaxID=3129254 RepID=UPI00307883E5
MPARPRTFLLASLAGLALLAAPAAAQNRVLQSFKVGDGSDRIGVFNDGTEVETAGPAAIQTGPNGQVYVLDQVNGRILTVDGDKPAATPKAVDLPAGLAPKDLVAVDGKLYVWDGGVHALQPGGGADGRKYEARSVGDVDDVVKSAFAQMGSQTPTDAEEILADPGRSLGKQPEFTPIRQFVQSRGFGAVKVDVIPGRDQKSAQVEVRQDADPLNAIAFPIRVTSRLGSVEILDVTQKREVYVFVEDVPLSTKQKPALYVARYTGRGALDRIYDVPITADQAAVRRFVTVGPKGNVLFLRSDTAEVAILDLAARQPRAQVLEPPPAKSEAFDESTPGLLTAVKPGTRSGVIQTALGFEALKWTVTQSAYGRDPDEACVGFDRIRRPWYLQGKLGEEVRGVPYCWGCFGSLAQFRAKIERGARAGNVCTREDPKRDLAGVDCSAFVSAAWGLSRQYTTRDIPSITKPLDDPWSLKPGDALNKPGSHVMLFVKFTPDRKVEVLEAATSSCNGKVCRNVYPLSVLLARGYTPVRYTALTD